MILSSVLRFGLLIWVIVPFVAASSSDAVFGVSKSSKLPEWLTIHKDREKMSEYMELARQRHVESVQKAREAYFHGNVAPVEASASSSSYLPPPPPIDSLTLDEYEIKAAGSIPDFVDELERKLFVTQASTPLFTKEECQEMVSKAEDHFQGASWDTLPSGQYDVAGFWIKNIPECHNWFNRMIQERLFPLLVKQFPHFCPNMEDLCVDNAYVFKYTPETGRRTDIHTDSGCLSFTISLNANDEYSGGGTWFEGLETADDDDDKTHNNVIDMNVGQCTVRPGGVRHCGHAVTSGTRYIIGGFCMNVNKVEYVRMLMGLGSEESSKKNYKTAQEALEAAIALNPDFDGPYSHLADLFTKQGEIAKAQQVLEHCFQNVNPQSGEVAYSLGVIYLDQAQYDNAKKCMQACLDSDDCDVDAMMVMAQVCAGKNDNSGEEEWYQRIVSTPGASPSVAGKAYCNLGVLHEGTDQEIVYYEKSLELVPDSFPPYFSLGCAYASKQNWGPAIQAFRKAIDAAEDKSDDQSQALQNLYRVTMGKLQNQSPTGPSSKEEMMKNFTELMGEENYQRLAAMRQG
jgi:tetratricopeptide (TPR) repeat protein